MAKHILQTDLSGNDFDVTSNIVTLVDKVTKQEYTEISTNTEHSDYANYIVDTTSNTVTINIPYEEVRAFTVRDWKKEFDTNECIITIRDSVDAIAHTATLDKNDKGYIFYNSGGTEDDWRYGEIGKGKIEDVASDHTASTDFGDLVEENADYSCVEIKGMACYESTTVMGTNDNDIAHKKYVDEKVDDLLPKTMTITPTANIENLDVSSLSPIGTLFVDNDSYREMKSLSGGLHGDIVHLVHLTNSELKLKRSDGYTGQQIEMPNNADEALTSYGGCTLIYNSTEDYWYATGLFY